MCPNGPKYPLIVTKRISELRVPNVFPNYDNGGETSFLRIGNV